MRFGLLLLAVVLTISCGDDDATEPRQRHNACADEMIVVRRVHGEPDTILRHKEEVEAHGRTYWYINEQWTYRQLRLYLGFQWGTYVDYVTRGENECLLYEFRQD